MNALTNVKNIKKLSEEELKGKNRTSWHEQYRSSAWVFIGGLSFDLTEGDVICVFSQFGELVNINLVRDKETGKSKGFCFICYEDQRSTDLAVDNLNGIKILGRTIRVDHVENYKPPKKSKDKDEQMKIIPKVHKGTLKKTNFNGDDDVSRNEIFLDNYDLKQHKNKAKKSERGGGLNSKVPHSKKEINFTIRKKEKHLKADFSFEKASETKNQVKSKNFEPLNLENSSPSSPSSSSSSSSSSSITSSSSSSSSISSSSLSSEEKGKEKIKNSKKDKNQRKKKNRSIEDLKREARLIQAELKRRQQTEESVTESFEFDEKCHSRKKFRSGSNEKDKGCNVSKLKQEKIKSFEKEKEKEKKRNYSKSAISRDRRR